MGILLGKLLFLKNKHDFQPGKGEVRIPGISGRGGAFGREQSVNCVF
jgi:hypothetical protein